MSGRGILTISSDVTQCSNTITLYFSVRRIEKFDQGGNSARLHDLPSVSTWIRTLSIGHGTGPDETPHLSVSYSAEHQSHCVELVYPSNERVARGAKVHQTRQSCPCCHLQTIRRAIGVIKVQGILCLERVIIQPTALTWTSMIGLDNWRIRGPNPPSLTIRRLFLAKRSRSKSDIA